LGSRKERVARRREILGDALKDNSSDVRAAAARGLEVLEGESDRQHLVERLHSDTMAERLQAVHGLAGLPHGLGTPGLAQALRDVAEDVRVAAARGLGELRDIRAISALVASMEDDSENVKIAVLEALAGCADHRLAPQLLTRLEGVQSKELLVAFLRALGATRDESVEGALLSHCTNPQASVRAAALEALAQLE
jgi:HEAT repeat protein